MTKEIYIGEWQSDMRHGYGTLNYASNDGYSKSFLQTMKSYRHHYIGMREVGDLGVSMVGGDLPGRTGISFMGNGYKGSGWVPGASHGNVGRIQSLNASGPTINRVRPQSFLFRVIAELTQTKKKMWEW